VRKGATGYPCRSAGLLPSKREFLCAGTAPRAFGAIPQIGNLRYTSPPVPSGSIQPNPGESDRMKPIIDCNGTMARLAGAPSDAPLGAVAADTPERQRPATADPGSVVAIHLFTRLHREVYRKTKGRFSMRDSAFLRTFSACCSMSAWFCTPDYVPKSCCRKRFRRHEGRCKTNPNDGRVQDWKTPFFHGNTNISTRLGAGEKTCFCETNPNREEREFAATDCKPEGYLKMTWRELTVLEAKRSQMRRWSRLRDSSGGKQKERLVCTRRSSVRTEVLLTLPLA